MTSGCRPSTRNWSASRLAKVVLPDDDGPAMSTIRLPTDWSASWAIFFSWSASLIRMISGAAPATTRSLSSPTSPRPRMSSHWPYSWKTRNRLGCEMNSGTVAASPTSTAYGSGMIRMKPGE